MSRTLRAGLVTAFCAAFASPPATSTARAQTPQAEHYVVILPRGDAEGVALFIRAVFDTTVTKQLPPELRAPIAEQALEASRVYRTTWLTSSLGQQLRVTSRDGQDEVLVVTWIPWAGDSVQLTFRGKGARATGARFRAGEWHRRDSTRADPSGLAWRSLSAAPLPTLETITQGEPEVYPPTPDFLTIPPMPKPRSVIGQTVQMTFEVDEHGRVTAFEMTPTSDEAYNERIRQQFLDGQFRPAVRSDGTPVPGRATLTLRL
jgi:hypothetical protein